MSTPLEFTAPQMRQIIAATINRNAWTQTQAAAKIGVSRAFLSDVLNGKRNPSGKLLTFFGFERHVSYRFMQKPACTIAPTHDPKCICSDCEAKRGRMTL